MKAVQYQSFGGPEVLEVVDVPDPKMFADLVLVRIEAAALNPADLAFQAGYADPLVDSLFPVTPGWDLAGVIEQAGPATTGFRPGDEVIGFVRDKAMHYGTYAEKISAEPRQLVRKPRNLSWAQAAGLPVAGLTAYQAIVHSLEVTAGDTVLVHGAAGGVGHLAVQIAVARGARVIGTGSEASQAFIESLGATPVRYGDELVEQVRKIAPDGVDAVLDTAGRGSLTTTHAIAALGARVASITRSTTEYAGTIDVYLHLDGDDLTRLVELAEEGKLTVHVERAFPLGEAAQAQQLLAAWATSEARSSWKTAGRHEDHAGQSRHHRGHRHRLTPGGGVEGADRLRRIRQVAPRAAFHRCSHRNTPRNPATGPGDAGDRERRGVQIHGRPLRGTSAARLGGRHSRRPHGAALLRPQAP